MTKNTSTNERTLYAKRLIQSRHYMTLATADNNGQPWNSPVFCAYDGEKTFYWGSRLNTQHSQNIALNDRGFIVIYDSTVEPNHGEAFYARVVCKELTDLAEINHAMHLLHERFGAPYMTIDGVQGSAERRLYKATIEAAWVKNKDKDIREEVQL